jgi:nucleoside-diphosphate-sugar epimerase
MKILLTGGEGYISKIIFENFKNSLEITKISRKDFDLTDSFETLKFFSNRYFDVVIHCAVVGGSRLKIDDFTVMDDLFILVQVRKYINLIHHMV